MITTYKIVEKVPNVREYLPIYFREDTIFLLGETVLTFNKPGYHSYKTKEAAFEELSNVVHDNVKSLRTIGCDEEDLQEVAKGYVILECELPEEAIITVEGDVIQSKTIKPIKQIN